MALERASFDDSTLEPRKRSPGYTKSAFKWANLYRYAAELARLPSLDRVSLSGNNLETSTTAALLDTLPASLVILELQKNQLTELPAKISNFASLQKLDASDNLLWTVDPAKLEKLPKLNHLDLRNNPPLKSVPYEIGQLKNIIGVWVAWDSGVVIRSVGVQATLDEGGVTTSRGGGDTLTGIIAAQAKRTSAEPPPPAAPATDVEVLLAWRKHSPALPELWPEVGLYKLNSVDPELESAWILEPGM